jgi:hypothetical protein
VVNRYLYKSCVLFVKSFFLNYNDYLLKSRTLILHFILDLTLFLQYYFFLFPGVADEHSLDENIRFQKWCTKAESTIPSLLQSTLLTHEVSSFSFYHPLHLRINCHQFLVTTYVAVSSFYNPLYLRIKCLLILVTTYVTNAESVIPASLLQSTLLEQVSSFSCSYNLRY